MTYSHDQCKCHSIIHLLKEIIMPKAVTLVQATKLDISVNTTTSTDVVLEAEEIVSIDLTAKSVRHWPSENTKADFAILASTASEYHRCSKAGGVLKVAGHWLRIDDAQGVIKQAAKDGLPRQITLHFANGSFHQEIATVTQRSWDAQVSNVISATFSFHIPAPVATESTPS